MVSGAAQVAGHQSSDGAAHPSATAVTKAGLLTSKYTGVCWNKKNKRWQASINSGGKYLYLGSFQNEDEAAQMFDLAAIKLRGTKAKLNFPLETYVDANGQLIENEALNATIAVHEQLVLTQKLATAQALALAGVTKRPRAGAGGAAATAAATAAAKRLARANATKASTASEGTNTQSAAAQAVHSSEGAPAAAAVGFDMSEELHGHSNSPQHHGIDVTLLQQAATAAATQAARATAEQQQRHQQPRQLEQLQHHQHHLQQPQMQPLQRQQQRQDLGHIQGSAMQRQHQQQQQDEQQLHVQAAQLADLLEQHAGWNWQQQQTPRDLYPVAPADTLLPGVPLDGQEQQQRKYQEPQLDQQQHLVAASKAQQWQQQTATSSDMLPASSAATATAGPQQQQQVTCDAAIATGIAAASTGMQPGQAIATVPVIRLSDLSCHVPAGGELLMLVPGEGSLCGVVYSQPTPEGIARRGTALWDGSVWHTGGAFGSEASAVTACQFAVTFAKQLAVSAIAPAAANLQRQDHSHLQTQQAAGNQSSLLATDGVHLSSSSAMASPNSQQREPAKISSASSKSSRGSICVHRSAATAGGGLPEQVSLDQLVAAAGALLEQQLPGLISQPARQEPALPPQQQDPRHCTTHQTATSDPALKQAVSSPLGAHPQHGVHHQELLAAPSTSVAATQRTTYVEAQRHQTAVLKHTHSQKHPEDSTQPTPDTVVTAVKSYSETLEPQQQVAADGCVPTAASLQAAAAPSISLEMLVDLGLLPRLSAARLSSHLQQLRQESDQACQQKTQQQHHWSSTPLDAAAAAAPATTALDSVQPQQHNQGSGISAALVQLLQQVASDGDTLAPQHNIDLLGSLESLIKIGSGSYESQLFNILCGSSGAAGDQEVDRGVAKNTTIPSVETAVHKAYSPQHPALVPQSAIVSPPALAVDDYGAFGGEAGIQAAAAAAAAATAVALGSPCHQEITTSAAATTNSFADSQRLSPAPNASPMRGSNPGPRQSSLVSFLDVQQPHAPAVQGAAGSLSAQHGSDLLAPLGAQTANAAGSKRWVSTLGAYLFSMKELDQQLKDDQHQQQFKETQHEDHQCKKRRRLLVGDKLEPIVEPMATQQHLAGQADHSTAQRASSV